MVLTSYEFVINKNDAQRLADLQWRYLVLDEGHRIKNANCQLSRVLRTYKIAHKLLLTGTPLQNDLSELWSLLNFLVRTMVVLALSPRCNQARPGRQSNFAGSS